MQLNKITGAVFGQCRNSKVAAILIGCCVNPPLAEQLPRRTALPDSGLVLREQGLVLPLVRPRPNSRNTARACPREAAIIVHVVAVADHDLANSPRAIMSGANPVPVAAPASNGGSLTANNDSKVANIAATLGNLDGKSLGLGPKLSALFQGMKKLSVAETQSCLQCSKKDVMRLAHNTSEIYCAGCISAVKSSLSSPWASWAAEPLSGILCECKKKKDVLRMQDDLCYPGVIAGLLQAHALEDWLAQQRLQPRTGRGASAAFIWAPKNPP